MHSLSVAIYQALNSFYVGFPNCIASSMRMAYVVTEMNTFATNITFSHFDTSSTSSYLIIYYMSYTHNIDILTENENKSKRKYLFFLIFL